VFTGLVTIFAEETKTINLYMKTIKNFLSVFSVALLGAGVALTVDHFYLNERANYLAEQSIRSRTPVNFVGLKSLPGGQAGMLPENNMDFVSSAQKAVPAVVYIESKVRMEGERTYNSLWDYFYGQSRPNIIEGEVSGSGVVVSADGYIVTNNHVVDEAGKIEVTMSNKKKYVAKVIGKDPETDLALLKIDATNLPFIDYGNSDDLQVGQWVLAVGNPYNLTSTVTAGIVSAKGRNIDLLPREVAAHRVYPIESYIQTDAAVNPGNSGGALVNTAGQLVGINSAIASTTGSYTGYSFAIPVNLVRKVVADLLQYGNVQRAFLGISISNVDEEIAKTAGLSSVNGVYVDSVLDGAAKISGIKQGDVILKIGDQEINDVSSLEEQVGRYSPGDKVNVNLYRDGTNMDIMVTLRNLDGTTSVVMPTKSTDVELAQLGVSLAPLSDDEKQRLNLTGGAKIAQLNEGTLKDIGIRRGFIITKIDHQKVDSPEEAKNMLDEKSGGVLVEGIYPNGMRAYYAFGM
jgi:serine protease Do